MKQELTQEQKEIFNKLLDQAEKVDNFYMVPRLKNEKAVEVGRINRGGLSYSLCFEAKNMKCYYDLWLKGRVEGRETKLLLTTGTDSHSDFLGFDEKAKLMISRLRNITMEGVLLFKDIREVVDRINKCMDLKEILHKAVYDNGVYRTDLEGLELRCECDKKKRRFSLWITYRKKMHCTFEVKDIDNALPELIEAIVKLLCDHCDGAIKKGGALRLKIIIYEKYGYRGFKAGEKTAFKNVEEKQLFDAVITILRFLKEK